MTLTFWGTGTSTGVPLIGCHCPVCTSTDSRNARRRASVMLTHQGQNVLIDAGPDFRQQALNAHLQSLAGVLLTHSHADHVLGLDDLRPLSWEQGLKVWADAKTLERLQCTFPYFFNSKPSKNSRPNLFFHTIQPGQIFTVAGLDVLPLAIEHGDEEILGYRVGATAYLTDCSRIPEKTFPLLKDLDVLILGALRHRPHPTHMNIDQAIEAAAQIGASQTYLTHLSHELEHTILSQELPPQIAPAFDGQCLENLITNHSQSATNCICTEL